MNRVFLFDVGGIIKYPFSIKEFHDLLKLDNDPGEFEIFFRRICSAVEAGQISDEEFFNGIINQYNLNITTKEVINVYNNVQEDYNPEVLKLLKRIKNSGHKVYIVSNLKEIDYENFIRDVSHEYYDKFYKSYEIGHNKPDKEIFEYVIKDIGVKPEEIIFFDDNKNNIDGALEFGIDARWTDVYHIVEYFEENNYFDIE